MNPWMSQDFAGVLVAMWVLRQAVSSRKGRGVWKGGRKRWRGDHHASTGGKAMYIHLKRHFKIHGVCINPPLILKRRNAYVTFALKGRSLVAASLFQRTVGFVDRKTSNINEERPK